MANKSPKHGGGESEGPLKTLKAVYEFMTQNGLDAVEIVEDGAQVKLVRRKAPTVPVPVPVAMGGYAPIAAAPASTHAAPQAPAHASPIPAGTAVKSPMMGIFDISARPTMPS